MAIFYDNGVIDTPRETANVKQIYAIINEAAQQALGQKAIEAIDTTSFISLGDDILASNANMDAFMSALTLMFSRTIISSRAYESKFDLLELSDAEYGAYLRKISFKMPMAKPDDSVLLENGKSVDMYVVNKPEVVQKTFGKVGTWTYSVTWQRKWLKDAFRSESEMERFLSGVLQYVKNRQEIDREDLGKLVVANFASRAAGTSREIPLVSMFNADTGGTVTATNAQFSNDFIRYAIGTMQSYADYMTDMSTRFNDGSVARFTPDSKRIVYMEAMFRNRMNTEALYAAFNQSYLKLETTRTVSYWQAQQSPRKIMINDKEVDNVVAMMFDRDAVGFYRHSEESYSTPINARGRYVNTFWFVDYAPLNDDSENGIIFTLN